GSSCQVCFNRAPSGGICISSTGTAAAAKTLRIHLMKNINRRTFLATTGVLAAGHFASSNLVSGSPNEIVGVGFVGVGSRGTVLLNNLLSISGFAVRAVCDIDVEHLEHAQELV